MIPTRLSKQFNGLNAFPGDCFVKLVDDKANFA